MSKTILDLALSLLGVALCAFAILGMVVILIGIVWFIKTIKDIIF